MLKQSIENSYFFEMYVEDLPMWGYIGDVDSPDFVMEAVEEYTTSLGTSDAKTYLFPHLIFKFGMNNDQIVSVMVNTDVEKRVDITDTSKPIEVKFSYAVEFVPTTLQHKERMKMYTHSKFVSSSLEIHWLSIINSFVLVLLLTTFLTIILMRVLKNDFSKYMELDDETMDEEESGWKLIHGDVFRYPQNSTLFCA